jgi:hypothetical protein
MRDRDREGERKSGRGREGGRKGERQTGKETQKRERERVPRSEEIRERESSQALPLDQTRICHRI